MSLNYQAYIFDFDGTLYDNKSMGFHLILSDVFHMFMIGAERTARKNLRGVEFASKEEFLKTFYNHAAKVCHVSEEKFAVWYEQKYIRNLDKVLKRHYKAFPDAEKVFKQFRDNGAKVCVFSDYSMVEDRMRAIGLNPESVDFTIDAEEYGALKPAVSPFLKVAEKMQIDPANILMIGDRLSTDGLGAVNAGMNFLQIDTHRDEKGTVTINGKQYPSMPWNSFLKEALE